MLTNGEDKRIVDSQSRALGLHYVEIMALRMGDWVTQHKVIRWVVTSVGYWKSKGKRMRDLTI